MKDELATEAVKTLIKTMKEDAATLTAIMQIADEDIEGHSRNAAIGGMGQMDECLERLAATLSAARAIHRAVR